MQLYELINMFLNNEVNVKGSPSLSSSPFDHCASHLPFFFFFFQKLPFLASRAFSSSARQLRNKVPEAQKLFQVTRAILESRRRRIQWGLEKTWCVEWFDGNRLSHITFNIVVSFVDLWTAPLLLPVVVICVIWVYEFGDWTKTLFNTPLHLNKKKLIKNMTSNVKYVSKILCTTPNLS